MDFRLPDRSEALPKWSTCPSSPLALSGARPLIPRRRAADEDWVVGQDGAYARVAPLRGRALLKPLLDQLASVDQ